MPESSESAIFQWTSAWGRLITSAFFGSAAYLGSLWLDFDLRLLITYDLAISAYLAMLFLRMSCADTETTRRLAEQKETSNRLMLTLAAMLSGCSLAGVGLMLHRSADDTPLTANLHLGLSLLAVFLSWILMHALFGIHYSRLYYDRDEKGDVPPWGLGLVFPDDAAPDFWDFMYFSFTLAVCYQVSDVTIRSRHIRRVALTHMLLSFLNVTLIIGIVVEIVSTVVSVPGSVK